MTSLTKLCEYVAVAYATSKRLCDKNDEVITAMYFLWRPVNYSLAKIIFKIIQYGGRGTGTLLEVAAV